MDALKALISKMTGTPVNEIEADIIPQAIEQITAAYNGGSGGGAMSNEAKAALIDCFSNVAWTDENGAARVERLRSALNVTPEPEPDEPTQSVIDGNSLSWERGYINANGKIEINTNQTGGYTCDYFNVESHNNILIELDGATVLRSAFYDSDKTFISRILNANGEIPSNAVYAKASIVKESIGNDGFDGVGVTITLS